MIDGQNLSLAAVPLAEGSNTLTVTVRDRAGNSGSASVTLTLDTIPPVPPTLSAPVTPTNQAQLALAGNAEAASNVKFFRQQADGSATQVGSAQADADGHFSIAGLSLAEGNNSFFATATDAAGNEGSPGAAVAVVLDTVPPLLTIAAPADQSFTNQPNAAVNGSADEPLATASVNGHPATVNGAAFDVAGIPLSEGANPLTVTATDLAGNSATAGLTLQLDTVPPQVTIGAPVAGLLTNQAQVDLAASVDEPILSAAVGDQPAAIDGQNLSLAAVPLVEGSNTLTVTVHDRAGNPGSASVTVLRDSTPPAPPVFDPVASPTNVGQAILQGSAEPFAAVRIVRTGVDPEEVLGLVAAGADGRFQLSGVALQEGENRFGATATDAAGNRSDTAAVLTVVLDTVPPTIALAAPADGLFTNAAGVAVAGSVDEPVATVTVNGTAASLTGTDFALAALPLLEDANNIVVAATDLAGNVGTISVTVTRDTRPPVVTLSAPAAGALTRVATVTVSGSVDEPILTLTLNGQAVPFTGQSFTRAEVPLLEGENTLTVAATDRAGNVGTASVTLTRDSTPPAAPQLTAPASPTRIAVTVLAGTAEAGAAVAVSVEHADGSSETLPAVTAGADGTFSLADIPLAEGANTLSAIATDAAGNPGEPATVTVVLDTVAPKITVTAPADGSVSDLLDIVVTGSVDETDATLTIDGVAVPLENGAFDHPLTLQPGSNTLILLATDPAGNVGTASVTLQADGTPPTVIISAPLPGTLTSQASLTVTGSVDEDLSALSLNGQPFAVTGHSFSLPASLVEGENVLTVAATDRAGNVGTAAVTVTRDSQPPQLTLDGPASADAGATVTLHLSALDASPLSLVELRSGGVVVWSGGGAGADLDQSVPYSLAPDLAAGATVALEAAAIDAAGNRGEAQLSITVAKAAAGPGYLRGEVYDDSRGLLLNEAAVSVRADGAEVAAAVTGADGGYFFELPAGNYLVVLSKAGYTSVERTVTVQPALNLQLRDARLTPVTGAVERLDGAGGTPAPGPERERRRPGPGAGTPRRPARRSRRPAAAAAEQPGAPRAPAAGLGAAGGLAAAGLFARHPGARPVGRDRPERGDPARTAAGDPDAGRRRPPAAGLLRSGGPCLGRRRRRDAERGRRPAAGPAGGGRELRPAPRRRHRRRAAAGGDRPAPPRQRRRRLRPGRRQRQRPGRPLRRAAARRTARRRRGDPHRTAAGSAPLRHRPHRPGPGALRPRLRREPAARRLRAGSELLPRPLRHQPRRRGARQRRPPPCAPPSRSPPRATSPSPTCSRGRSASTSCRPTAAAPG